MFYGVFVPRWAERSAQPGYEGEESVYLTKAVLDAAYNDSGLALDFYKSYNPEFHDPGKRLGVKVAWGARPDLIARYFSTLASIPTSEMEACDSSEFSNAGRMQMYKDFSGDAAGAETRGPGLALTCTPFGRELVARRHRRPERGSGELLRWPLELFSRCRHVTTDHAFVDAKSQP